LWRYSGGLTTFPLFIKKILGGYMENKFTVEIEYIKNDTLVCKEFYEENMNKVIDNFLLSLKDEDVHLAVWTDPDINIGEIIVLDNKFENEQHIKITKINDKKELIESVTL
jgi:predicted transposase YbfD/YdcC